MNETPEIAQKLCRQCNSVVDADARFCKNCAYDLTKTAETISTKDDSSANQTSIEMQSRNISGFTLPSLTITSGIILSVSILLLIMTFLVNKECRESFTIKKSVCANAPYNRNVSFIWVYSWRWITYSRTNQKKIINIISQ